MASTIGRLVGTSLIDLIKFGWLRASRGLGDKKMKGIDYVSGNL